MKLKTNELKQALVTVKPGLANKEIIQQATSFAFMKNRVVTYNDEMSISHPLKGIDLQGAIKAEELYGLLSKLNNAEINLELDEKELKLKCGRVRAGLKIEKEINLPIKDEINIKKWSKLPDPDTFNRNLKLCMHVCATDITQHKLTCVNITKNGNMHGSDSYRLIQCKGGKLPVKGFLLPANLVNEIVKLYPEKISLNSSWVHFKNSDGVIISCRIINETYLEQERIDEILSMHEETQIEFPSKIDDMLNRVSEFAKRDSVFDEQVEVHIKEGKLLMRSETEGTKSWIEEKGRVKSDFDVSFNITPTLFRDILKQTQVCELDKETNKAKFSAEDGSWEYIISLRQ